MAVLYLNLVRVLAERIQLLLGIGRRLERIGGHDEQQQKAVDHQKQDAGHRSEVVGRADHRAAATQFSRQPMDPG